MGFNGYGGVHTKNDPAGGHTWVGSSPGGAWPRFHRRTVSQSAIREVIPSVGIIQYSKMMLICVYIYYSHSCIYVYQL